LIPVKEEGRLSIIQDSREDFLIVKSEERKNGRGSVLPGFAEEEGTRLLSLARREEKERCALPNRSKEEEKKRKEGMAPSLPQGRGRNHRLKRRKGTCLLTGKEMDAWSERGEDGGPCTLGGRGKERGGAFALSKKGTDKFSTSAKGE